MRSRSTVPRDYAKDFFPQPGDPDSVVANKKLLREQKMANARAGFDKGGESMIAKSDAPQMKAVNGKKYKKVPGGWEELTETSIAR